MKKKIFTALFLVGILARGIFAQLSRVILMLLFCLITSCASFFEPVKYYDPVQVKGRGSIVVDAEYITYQNITRTREVFVGGVTGSTTFVAGGGVYSSPSKEPYIRTETYTERVPVKADYNLSFLVLENGVECFRGNTPIRVSNFDPGVTYKVVWIGTNKVQKEGTFVITTASPFTRYIHLE